MWKHRFILNVFIGIFTVLFSCTSTHSEDTLYDELGGLDTLNLITDTWIDSLKTDPMVSGYFAPLFADSIATLNFRNHVVELFCSLSGGLCVYKGRAMRNTHAGMNIQAEEFDAAIQDLRNAMGVWSISDEVSTRFLSRIQLLQPEIVGQ
jgi:Truncated hemoglobins